jgi:site-specific DNA-adenine methylase
MNYEEKEKLDLLNQLSKNIIDDISEQIEHLKKTNKIPDFYLVHRDEFQKKIKTILDEFLILYRN